MSFTGFNYDVFLSYARADDKADRWVSRFEEGLKNHLGEYKADVEVFQDTRTLDVNQRFDATIKDALQGSAVLLTVMSPRFKESVYCRQEVHWFCEAANRGAGLTVGPEHHTRTFNVLRFKIAYEQWFSDLMGINATTFFKDERELGTPINPESEEGVNLIRGLAEKISKTLTLIKSMPRTKDIRRSLSSTDPATVFLAPTYNDLLFDQMALRERLNRSDLSVAVREAPTVSSSELIGAFRTSDLSIVMVDDRLGRDTLEQLELAAVYADRWILVVHPEVNLSNAASDEYHARLEALRDGQGRRNYGFIHHHSPDRNASIDVSEICDEAIAILKAIRQERESKEVMLDGIEKDRPLMKEIERYLETKQVGTRWAVYRNYEDLFNQCRGTMLFYGASEKEWIEGRLAEVRKAFREPGNVDKTVGVLYGPPPDGKERVGPTLKVGRSLVLLLQDIDYSRNWKAEIDAFLKLAGL